MPELIGAHEIITIKQYLRSVHNGTLHDVLRYVEQLERERDGLLTRCEHLRAQLDQAEREPTP